jgi:ubiquinone/menaquinone biosynthesis C-methylase UbiE
VKSAFNKGNQPAILRVFQSKDQIKAFYNETSHIYDVLSQRSEAPMLKAGLELLNARVGESVLEINFGPGHCLVTLAKANLAKARMLERTRLRCGDAAHLHYSNNSQDGFL